MTEEDDDDALSAEELLERIATLETQVATLETQVAALEKSFVNFPKRIATLLLGSKDMNTLTARVTELERQNMAHGWVNQKDREWNS